MLSGWFFFTNRLKYYQKCFTRFHCQRLYRLDISYEKYIIYIHIAAELAGPQSKQKLYNDVFQLIIGIEIVKVFSLREQ